MAKFKQLTVRLDHEVHRIAVWKADKLGLPLATLVRIFLKAFSTQRGVGFYIGDQDLAYLFNRTFSNCRTGSCDKIRRA